MLSHTRKILIEKLNSVKSNTYLIQHFEGNMSDVRMEAHEMQILPSSIVFLRNEQIVYICPIDKVTVKLEEEKQEERQRGILYDDLDDDEYYEDELLF